jgi:hypothetical protein
MQVIDLGDSFGCSLFSFPAFPPQQPKSGYIIQLLEERWRLSQLSSVR